MVGAFVTSWGSAGSNDGQFLGLHDVTVDPEGKFVYSLELNNHRVQKFDSNGKFITKWGFNGTGGRDVQRSPHQIAVNSMGIVYLTDRNGNQILKFFPNGTFMETIGSKGAGPGQFDGPHGIAIDSDNDKCEFKYLIVRILLSDSGDLLETAQDNSRTPHLVLHLMIKTTIMSTL